MQWEIKIKIKMSCSVKRNSREEKDNFIKYPLFSKHQIKCPSNFFVKLSLWDPTTYLFCSPFPLPPIYSLGGECMH